MHMCKARALQLYLAASTVLALSNPAVSANTPCLGRKGDIAECEGDLFLCKDGSVTQKISCLAYPSAASPGDNQAAPFETRAECRGSAIEIRAAISTNALDTHRQACRP
ncbi:hypothetical protein D3C78_621890 [compost metagenome]